MTSGLGSIHQTKYAKLDKLPASDQRFFRKMEEVQHMPSKCKTLIGVTEFKQVKRLKQEEDK